MGLPCDSEAKYAGWLCTSDCLFVKIKDKVKELGSFWSVLPGSHGVFCEQHFRIGTEIFSLAGREIAAGGGSDELLMDDRVRTCATQ